MQVVAPSRQRIVAGLVSRTIRVGQPLFVPIYGHVFNVDGHGVRVRPEINLRDESAHTHQLPVIAVWPNKRTDITLNVHSDRMDTHVAGVNDGHPSYHAVYPLTW
jgi:hypothetical protein